MKYSTDEISEMFEEVLGLSEDSKEASEASEPNSYTTCPYHCASRGSEDWWC